MSYTQPNITLSIYIYTVEPLVSDHLKCQAYVVAYGRWSLMRAKIILGQNFASLAYRKRSNLTYVLNVLFMQKVNFKKTSCTSC